MPGETGKGSGGEENPAAQDERERADTIAAWQEHEYSEHRAALAREEILPLYLQPAGAHEDIAPEDERRNGTTLDWQRIAHEDAYGPEPVDTNE